MKRTSRTRAFTMVELLIVIGILALLISILLPALNRARETANRIKCASNLRQIGQSIMLYANQYKGLMPRTYFQGVAPGVFNFITDNTGCDQTDPFSGSPTGNVGVNNIPASLFLLLRTQQILPAVFICPSTDAVADAFGGGTNTAQNRCNFSDIHVNLSYSYQNPFTDTSAQSLGFAKLTNAIDPAFVIMADINPGISGTKDNVTSADLAPTAGGAILALGNSNNHSKSGQNVMYADGHVTFENSPFCGIAQDMIYTRGNGQPQGIDATNWKCSSADMNDTVLLPADD